MEAPVNPSHKSLSPRWHYFNRKRLRDELRWGDVCKCVMGQAPAPPDPGSDACLTECMDGNEIQWLLSYSTWRVDLMAKGTHGAWGWSSGKPHDLHQGSLILILDPTRQKKIKECKTRSCQNVFCMKNWDTMHLWNRKYPRCQIYQLRMKIHFTSRMLNKHFAFRRALKYESVGYCRTTN